MSDRGRINFQSYAINGYSYVQKMPALDFIRDYADRGCQCFELILHPGHIWPSEISPKEIRLLKQTLVNNGLKILSFGVPALDTNLTGVTAEVRKFSRGIVHSAIRLAEEIEVPGIILGPGKANPLLPASMHELTGWFYEALNELVPAAAAAGTQLLIENLPVAFVPDADGIMGVLEAHGDPRVGVVYDSANAAFIGEDLASGVQRVSSRLKRLHISDTTQKKFEHARVGSGDINFTALKNAILNTGYDLPAILEIISVNPDTDIPASMANLSDLGWDQLQPAI